MVELRSTLLNMVFKPETSLIKTTKRIETHNRVVATTADCWYKVMEENAIDIYVRQSILLTDCTMTERTCTRYCCGEPVSMNAMPGCVRLR